MADAKDPRFEAAKLVGKFFELGPDIGLVAHALGLDSSVNECYPDEDDLRDFVRFVRKHRFLVATLISRGLLIPKKED